MNFEGTKQKIKNTISALKAKEIDYASKSAELEIQRSQLVDDLEILKSEIQKMDDDEAKAAAGLAQAETEEIVDEITKQIAEIHARREAIRKALNDKQNGIVKLERALAKTFVNGVYPAEIATLKKQRDEEYKKLIACLGEIQELHSKILECEETWRALLSLRNTQASEIGQGAIAVSGWNISVEGANGKIGYALPADFGDFLGRVGEIIKSGGKLSV